MYVLHATRTGRIESSPWRTHGRRVSVFRNLWQVDFVMGSNSQQVLRHHAPVPFETNEVSRQLAWIAARDDLGEDGWSHGRRNANCWLQKLRPDRKMCAYTLDVFVPRMNILSVVGQSSKTHTRPSCSDLLPHLTS